MSSSQPTPQQSEEGPSIRSHTASAPAHHVYKLLLALLLVIGILFPRNLDDFWLVIAILTAYQAYLALSWNVVAGFAGQLSIGNAVFVAIGAYTSTTLAVQLDVTPWLGAWGGALVALVAGLVIGWMFFRSRLTGLAFALGTFALSQIALWLLIGTNWLGARDGIRIPISFDARDFQFRDRIDYYYVILTMLVVCLIGTWILRRSRLGYYFLAIREDPAAAEALGISLVQYKTIALATSAFLSALGGTFLAQFLLYVSPELLLKPEALLPPIIVGMFGGLGTITGPVVGAVLLVPLSHWLRSSYGATIPGIDLILYGAVLMGVMVFFPRGIVGTIERYVNQPKLSRFSWPNVRIRRRQ